MTFKYRTKLPRKNIAHQKVVSDCSDYTEVLPVLGGNGTGSPTI
jgi:hypothetical protein